MVEKHIFCVFHSPSVKTWDSTGSEGANHLPEFMSGDVPLRSNRAGGHSE